VVNRILPYCVFHLKGRLLYLEHLVKSKTEEAVNYRSIIVGFKINVVTYHLVLGNELNAIEPKLEV
jgi:ABC-type transport system involved in cytochrome c biogenesis permease subunit